MKNLSLHETTLATTPYPGLRPFRDDEAEIFFGREEQTDQLLEKLQRSRFIAVVGPSGCGKSSLVRAGLIAALETGFLADAGSGWRIAEMRPGDQPLSRLADALLDPSALGRERGAAASESAIVRAMLRRGPLGLLEILRETRLPAGHNLLLLVDQFEEIFRFREQGSADEADAFVGLLLASSAQREVPVYVVITMRSDFLGDCALFTGLPEAINEGQYLTPRLTRDQIQAAITGPARVFGSDVGPTLVNRLLNEIGPDPDQLPLLQHALMRMWTRVTDVDGRGAPPGVIPGSEPPAGVTTAEYEAVGALSEALSRHADQVLGGLTARQQQVTKAMLSRLTERGVGKRDTRHPARLDDVAAVAGAPTEEVIEIVEQLRRQDRSFLTPPPPIPLTPTTVLDIGHESLIRQWHRLYGWVEEEAASAAMYRRLLQTAHLWVAGKAALWSSPDLEEALQWRQERAPSAPWAARYGTGDEFDLAMEFLRASEERAAAEARRLQQEQEREREQQVRKVRLTRQVAAALGLCVIGTSAMAVWALDSRRSMNAALIAAEVSKQSADSQAVRAEDLKLQAERERDGAEQERRRAQDLTRMARSREIATKAAQQLQTDPELGLRLAMEAPRGTPEAQGTLQQALLASKLRGRVDAHSGAALEPHLTPDGNFVVGWNPRRSGSRVEIRNIKAGGRPITVDVHGRSDLIQLSPDGEHLVAIDAEGAGHVWKTATGDSIGRLSLGSGLTRTFFSPGGEIVGAMTAGGTMGFWDARDGRPLSTIAGPVRSSPEPELSHDSRYLVAAGGDRRLRLWETGTGREVALLDGDSARVTSASFSPDGRYIVATRLDGIAAIWSTESRQWVRHIGDASRPVFQVRFSPDGRQVVTTANDNFARVWSLARPDSGTELKHWTRDEIEVAEFSPDGQSILTLAGELIRIWQAPSPTLPGRFSPKPILLRRHGGEVRTARFSQDSRWVVSTTESSVTLWDAKTGQAVAGFAAGSSPDAWLSPDSRQLLTTSHDGIVRIWDTIDLGSVINLSDVPEGGGLQSEAEFPATLSRNGKYLLAVASDGVARVWLTSTGRVKATLGDSNYQVNSAALSPGGSRAMTIGSDGAARVWDVETAKVLGSFGPGAHESSLMAGNFSDARHPWTWYEDGIVEVWNLQGGKLYAKKEVGRPSCVTLSPDALWMVACGRELVQVTRLPSGRPVVLGGHLRGHSDRMIDVFFSENGKFAVSTSSDKTAKIWEVGRWRGLATLAVHDSAVTYAFFSPDTRTVATIATDNTVRLWETKTGRLLHELRGHIGLVKAYAFSKDGRWLATGSEDLSARVWDTWTGKAVAELRGHTGSVIAVAFGRDPKVIITASADGTVRRYHCDACVPPSELISIAKGRFKAIGGTDSSTSERLENLLR